MAILGTLLALCAAFPAAAQQACTASCTLSGIVNDYWAATGSPSAGATSISVGARRAGGAGNTIAVNDWVLVIQMQDAAFNSANTALYGASSAATTGTGYITAGQTGRYEFARATSAVGAGGGVLTLASGLVNSYNSTVSGAQTTPRFQVIRIPHCLVATLSGTLQGVAWNGTTGGVIALRGESVVGGGATVDASGIGFRGGATDAHNGPVNTDSYATSTNTNDQYKGEGIAGTPDYIYDTTTNNEIATGLVLPGGFRGRGAPGNAGGGGEGDSGAGGGGNGGFGGRGGTWDPGTIGAGGGGRGGSPFAEAAVNRVVLGGGGGGGSANTGATTATETQIPYGTAGRSFARGGVGGGIVIIGAATRSGNLTVAANGATATGTLYTSTTVGTRVGGGGGAGGSIVLFGGSGGGTVNASATGGNGYNDAPATGHIAHGGGGGGGVILAPAGSAPATSLVTGGRAGCFGVTRDTGATACSNADTQPNSSADGTAGSAATFAAGTAEPGAPSCNPAVLTVLKSNNVTGLTAGQTTSYSISVVNAGPSAAPGTVVTDPGVAGLNCTNLAFSSNPAGAVSAPPLSISALQSTGLTITPTFNPNSTATFTLTCGVTATGQ